MCVSNISNTASTHMDAGHQSSITSEPERADSKVADIFSEYHEILLEVARLGNEWDLYDIRKLSGQHVKSVKEYPESPVIPSIESHFSDADWEQKDVMDDMTAYLITICTCIAPCPKAFLREMQSLLGSDDESESPKEVMGAMQLPELRSSLIGLCAEKRRILKLSAALYAKMLSYYVEARITRDQAVQEESVVSDTNARIRQLEESLVYLRSTCAFLFEEEPQDCMSSASVTDTELVRNRLQNMEKEFI